MLKSWRVVKAESVAEPFTSIWRRSFASVGLGKAVSLSKAERPHGRTCTASDRPTGYKHWSACNG